MQRVSCETQMTSHAKGASRVLRVVHDTYTSPALLFVLFFFSVKLETITNLRCHATLIASGYCLFKLISLIFCQRSEITSEIIIDAPRHKIDPLTAETTIGYESELKENLIHEANFVFQSFGS